MAQSQWDAMLAQSRARSEERLARLTRRSAPVVLAPVTRTSEPEWKPTGKTQPAFGKLAIDRMAAGDAESASSTALAAPTDSSPRRR